MLWVLVGGIPWVPSGISQKMLKQIFKPPKILIFNININILTILILILILILGFEKFWYWFWYWGWENFDIDIDFDIEEIVWRILILILILKTKFLKILILILNKNLILCHVWTPIQLFWSILGAFYRDMMNAFECLKKVGVLKGLSNQPSK